MVYRFRTPPSHGGKAGSIPAGAARLRVVGGRPRWFVLPAVLPSLVLLSVCSWMSKPPGVAGVRSALIRPAGPVRYRGLGLCGRAGARPSFIRSEAVVRLPGPQSHELRLTQTARYANRHSDRAESPMSVGSTPTRATRQEWLTTSRGPMATTPLLQRGNGGSTPSGTIRVLS